MTNPPQDSGEPGPPPQYGQQPYGPAPQYGQPPYAPLPRAAQPHGTQPYGTQPYGTQPYGTQPPGQQPPYGQATFGAPGAAYGQPPAPAQKSRVGLIAAVTAGLLALIALGVVLALTLSSTVLDRNAVERDVAAQFEEREGVAIDLTCSQEMKVDDGATYECTGTTDDGEDVTLQIAITDEENASYTWTEP